MTAVARAAPSWSTKTAASPPEQKIKTRTMNVVSLASIEPRDVEWLWYPYFAHGFVTNFGGDPGVGKSFITCNLAANISRGDPLPGQSQKKKPRNVLMLSAEDPAREVLVPRLMSFDADRNHIFIPERNFQLNEVGISMLKDAMERSAATIVFIDPLTAYVEAKVDMFRDNEMRGMLGPLAEAAERTRTAIIIVQHLAKDSKRKDLYKFSGSIANVAGVRSAVLAEKLPEGGRVFRHIKNNLGPEGPARRYDIVQDRFEWGDIMGEDEYRKASVLPSNKPRRVAEARSWLISTLNQGPMPARDVLKRAEAAGFGERTINAAKKGLIISEKQPGKNGEWVWTLTAIPLAEGYFNAS